MSIPSYNDIGKKVKDLFEKEFPAGFIKVAAKFPSISGTKVILNGTQNIDSGKLASSLETKVTGTSFGKDITLTEKWTASNEIQSSLELNPAEKLKNVLEMNYEPSTGRKSFKVKTNYSIDMINFNADVEFRQLEPILTVHSMLKPAKNLPFFIGGLVAFDSFKRSVDKVGYGFHLSHNNDKFIVAGSLTNHKQVLVQTCFKPNDMWDLGVELNASINPKSHRLGVCIKQNLPNNSAIKAKVDCSMTGSLSYSFPVRESINLTFGAKVDLKNLNGGGHKLGLQIDI